MCKLAKLTLIVLSILVLSVFIGCGGSNGSGVKNPGDNNPQPQTYTVTFNSAGGSLVSPMHVNSGSAVSAPDSPAREDYDFEGWYSDSMLTAKVIFPYTVTRDITLYA